MINYIVGNPGSGKTYFAVYKIYELFLKPPQKSFIDKFFIKKLKKDNNKKPKYEYCYTNINEFKFELCDKFIPFDFDTFYENLSMLYTLYLDKKSDDEINSLAKDLKLNNIIIILDEAHNFLKSKGDNILIWWLTYHRHLYQDIYLITQDLSLINSEYKRIAEFFYKAVDSSRRIFKNKFRYIVYGSYKLYKKDEYSKFHIPYLNEVFNIYHSGNSSNQKSIVVKYFSIFLFLSIFLIIFFYFFIDTFKDKSKPENSNLDLSNNYKVSNYKENSYSKTNKTTSINDPIEILYIYSIICINETCHIKDNKIDFSESFLMFLISNNNPFYSKIDFKGSFKEYFLVFKAPYLENLKNPKGANDEIFNNVTNIGSNLFK